jgi:hypothetical protein
LFSLLYAFQQISFNECVFHYESKGSLPLKNVSFNKTGYNNILFIKEPGRVTWMEMAQTGRSSSANNRCRVL